MQQRLNKRKEKSKAPFPYPDSRRDYLIPHFTGKETGSKEASELSHIYPVIKRNKMESLFHYFSILKSIVSHLSSGSLMHFYSQVTISKGQSSAA